MKKLVYKIGLFFCKILVIIFSAHLYVNHILLPSIFTFDKNIDTIFIGNSHTETAVDVSFFDNAINLSKSSSSYYYIYLKLKQTISRNENIRKIYVSFSVNNLYKEQSLKSKNKYLPYIILIASEEWETLLSFAEPSKLLTYYIDGLASIIYNSIVGDIKTMYGSYLPLNNSVEITDVINITNDGLVDKNLPTINNIELKFLNRIINEFNNGYMEVVFINTPSFITTPAREYLHEEHIQYYCENYSNIKFYDFKKLTLKQHQFADRWHLNAKGAERYTKLLSDNDEKEKYLVNSCK